jgi:uncharacterized membrane protein YkvA (DUF1232 family)
MTTWHWLLLATGGTVVLYGGFVAWLLLAGRREDARALAGFVPDCLVLVRRLLGDARVPRRSKWMLVALIGYLVSPIDLVPDVIPVAGQLDDAILVAFVLRRVLRTAGPGLLREHWPGPEASLGVLARLADGDRRWRHRPVRSGDPRRTARRPAVSPDGHGGGREREDRIGDQSS